MCFLFVVLMKQNFKTIKKMKCINLLLIIVSGFGMIFLNSCSSPENEGKEIGEKFCNCIRNVKTLTEPRQFNQVMDSCSNEIKVEWTKYETDYKKDQTKWNLFVTSYENARKKKVGEFNDALKLVYAEIEKTIKKQLYNKLWLKKDEKKGFYIYSFTDNALTMINCKGETKFNFSVDTIKFEDNNLTMAIASFNKDGDLVLTDCKSKKKGIYQIATEKDKLLGDWNLSGKWTGRFTFYKGGTFTLFDRYTGVSRGRYSLKGNKIEMSGKQYESWTRDWVFSENFNLSKSNYFSYGGSQFSRNILPQHKILDILFTKS